MVLLPALSSILQAMFNIVLSRGEGACPLPRPHRFCPTIEMVGVNLGWHRDVAFWRDHGGAVSLICIISKASAFYAMAVAWSVGGGFVRRIRMRLQKATFGPRRHLISVPPEAIRL